VIVANLDAVRPLQEVTLEIEGDRRDDLLFDWLAELLYTFDARRLLLSEFRVRVGDRGLEATARGEPFDPDRHELDVEVKAITYHGLKVEREGDRWLAEVIVDL
jgi:SHS2 domain-containing protein